MFSALDKGILPILGSRLGLLVSSLTSCRVGVGEDSCLLFGAVSLFLISRSKCSPIDILFCFK